MKTIFGYALKTMTHSWVYSAKLNAAGIVESGCDLLQPEMDSKRQDFTPISRAFLLTLNIAGWIWSAVSFVPWFYLSGNYKKMKPGQKQAIKTRTGTYRCVGNVDHLVEDYEGMKTITEVFA